MAVPTQTTYSPQALVVAHTAIRDLIDSEQYPGYISFRDENDEEVFFAYFTRPCGTVNTNTGQIMITLQDSSVLVEVAGTVAYAAILDNSGSECLRLPAQQGNSPVSGKAVLGNLTFVGGETVEVASIVIG